MSYFANQCWTVLVAMLLLICDLPSLLAQDVDQLLQSAADAFTKKQFDQALELAGEAIAKDPKSVKALMLRGTIQESLAKHAEAVADFSRVIELDSRHAQAYNRRGSERFKQGQVKESVDDFNRYLELMPTQRNGHWQRGIALYYAGRFEEGKKQFEGYEQVDTNDVENAVWHFLCNARSNGVEQARKQLLKIGKDRRVPMTEVYALFAGKAKPEDVLASATAGAPSAELRNRQLFYAHLYLGLYYEVLGEKERALEHLKKAADEHKIEHYMWDVARVHRNLLIKKP
jgi:lipoprotein NlpI